MSRSRYVIAVLLGIVGCTLAIIPFALAINRFDWGIGLLLVAPLVVWVLLRLGRSLERWARNEPDVVPPDPDFPDVEDEVH